MAVKISYQKIFIILTIKLCVIAFRLDNVDTEESSKAITTLNGNLNSEQNITRKTNPFEEKKSKSSLSFENLDEQNSKFIFLAPYSDWSNQTIVDKTFDRGTYPKLRRGAPTKVETPEDDPLNTNSDRLLVRTHNGLVRGVEKTTETGVKVDVFLGIPFAKAPEGELRFRRPVPIDPWQGIFQADTPPNSCRQERCDVFSGFRGEEMWNPNTNVSEDCLYLNLWVPVELRNSVTNESGATVLIWIYGGGYMSGTSTLDVYDGLILAAANNVIVASINYRVGVFGFLYLGDEEAPGNMGLFDQALAIKWIKDNIRPFGGNPESITLFGESAGAGSVSAHLLSPVSRHLIRRGILQSGSVNAPWSYMTADTSKKIAAALISEVGCNASLIGAETSQVMRCMREMDGKKLSIAQWKFYWGILGFPSAPTIDGAFLPAHPVDMLKNGNFKNTDILVGTNQDEGTYFILYDFIQYFKKDDPSFLERDKFLDIINTIFKNWSQLEREAIIFQYTDWDHIDNGYLNQKMIGDVVGDYYFTCPANYFAQRFAEHGSNVYYYYFTQRSSTSPWGQWMGVMHADEIDYVFGHPTNLSRDFTNSERDLSRRMMNYFSTFAKTGKPVAEDSLWPIYSRNKPQYFILNGGIEGIGHGPRATACAFWNEFMPILTKQVGQCDRNFRPSQNSARSLSMEISSVFAFLTYLSFKL